MCLQPLNVISLLLFFPEGNLWQVASKLNCLLTSENERLQQLTEDLKQKHIHMTSEVQIKCLSLFRICSPLEKMCVKYLIYFKLTITLWLTL